VEKTQDLIIMALYAVAAISGASGGCLVAAHHILRGRTMTQLFIAAYVFVGLIFGTAGVIAAVSFGGVTLTFEKAFLLGLFFGAVGSTSLAGANLSARFLLRRLGIEMTVSLRNVDETNPGANDDR
jgi:hypothetical protein